MRGSRRIEADKGGRGRGPVWRGEGGGDDQCGVGEGGCQIICQFLNLYVT
jgi:hypothetical protein